MRTSEPGSLMVTRPNLSAFLLVTIAACLTSCAKHDPVLAANAKPSEIPSVAVARASTEDLSHGLVLTAEFKPFQEVEVMAKVSGYIKQIYVDVGERVRQGQLLATLEIPEMGDDLKRADATVIRAKADVTRARDELHRAESAHNIARLSFERLSAVAAKKPGLIAQQEIDEAQSRELMTEAQLAGAKSALNAAEEQVNVNSADTQKVKTLIDYQRVTAPFAGVVTKRYADTGSMIQAGTASQTQAMPVIKLSENSMLRLILPVPESAVPTVHIGQQVAVRVPTMNRSFPGRVARFSGKVSAASRTMDTEVDVPNSNLLLMPGMYAEVDLTLAQRNRVITIPVTALDSNHQVMVVTPNNRIEVRKLATGMESSDKVEVMSGLNEGDLVVVAGRASLQPGEEVKPKVTTMAAVKE
jgi:RND family efflux transporter MFP subunit